MPSFTPDDLYLEPFDGDLTIRGWSGDIATGPGRTVNCLILGGVGPSFSRAFDADDTYICGTAFKTPSYPSGGDDVVIGFARTGVTQVTVSYTPTGAWRLYRGSTVLWTSADAAVDIDAWLYVELKAIIDPTTGTLELVVNGVTLHTFSGNTKGASDNFIDTIFGNRRNSFVTQDYDDFYAWHGGSAVYLGNIRIRQYAPNADGTYSEYTPNSGSVHYNRVNQFPANDGDATFVSDSASGHRDSYSFSGTAVSGAVKAVQVHTVAKKDDIGSLQFEHLIRAGGTDYIGPAKTLTQSYQAFNDTLLKNPNTASDWVAGDFATTEFGTEIV
jgi:hypothetical protein